jgi:hypothetical protein
LSRETRAGVTKDLRSTANLWKNDLPLYSAFDSSFHPQGISKKASGPVGVRIQGRTLRIVAPKEFSGAVSMMLTNVQGQIFAIKRKQILPSIIDEKIDLPAGCGAGVYCLEIDSPGNRIARRVTVGN